VGAVVVVAGTVVVVGAVVVVAGTVVVVADPDAAVGGCGSVVDETSCLALVADGVDALQAPATTPSASATTMVAVPGRRVGLPLDTDPPCPPRVIAPLSPLPASGRVTPRLTTVTTIGTWHLRPRSGLKTVAERGAMNLEDVEAIRQLKYAYFRLLDTKQFDALGDLLTDDVTTAYQSGELAFTGRDAVVAFLGDSIGGNDIVTVHHGHHPEIAVTSPTAAEGTWYLEDRVIVPGHDFELHGTAIYADRYSKVDGRWLISHTGYVRIFEEQRRHSTGEVLSFTSRFATT
jgi:ketosteroid isomerase-like protein